MRGCDKMHVIKRILKIRELTSLLFLIVIFLLVGVKNPAFFSPDNIFLAVNGSVVYTIVAVGIALVIMTGEIDVSVGSTLGLAATVAATLVRDGSPGIIALLAAIAVGAAVGIVNGFGVTKLKIPSIIMTLGTYGIVRGLSYLFTGGKWVENLPVEFKSLSQISFGHFNLFYIIVILFIAAIYLFQEKSRIGKYFKAVGDNENGAVLVGIPVRNIKMISFLICGVFAGIAGTAYASRVGFVTPMAGNGYEMKAIAACVLGGISLSGGVGSMAGAGIGAILMSSISRLLVFLQLPSDYDNTITGILLIVIVVADRLLQLRSMEKARKQRLGARIQTAQSAERR